MTTIDPSNNQASFGDLLWLWRHNQRLSQSAFGDLLVPKVLPSTVSSWERGIRYPTRQYVGQIVSLTNISAHLVLGIPAHVVLVGIETVSPEPRP